MNPLRPQADVPEVYVRADRSHWDMRNLVTVPLQEIIQFKEVVKNIISRDLKVRYKRSVLGVFWTILAPLFSMTVLWVVFQYALKVQIKDYASYLLSGLIVWNFFLQSSSSSCVSILNASSIIRKVKLPRAIFPISAVINNVVNFSFAFIALILVMLCSRATFHWTMIFAPLALVPLLLFSIGWGLMLSSLSVYFRDIQYITEIALGALFYLTPIVYAPHMLPEKLQWISSVNPIAKFIYLFRSVVYDGTIPNPQVFLVSLGMGLGMLFLGWIIFQRLQRNFLYWF